ncbi:pilus assembly protein PilP [Halomonas sp.]|uniref:pilus assembly protein PilP n=1 Tax=Halomonas sp. TaxID=1486246 RepID=UPI003D0A0DDF
MGFILFFRALLALLFVFLVGCSDPDIAELDRRLSEIRNDPGPAPELEVPDFSERTGIVYELGELRSPFQSEKSEPDQDLPGPGAELPDDDRPKGVLEKFDLSELELVGTLTLDSKPFALIKEPGGKVHRVEVGDYLGQDNGRITAIETSSVLLVERILEQGVWVERTRDLTLGS